MALENILILAAASLLWATIFRNHGRTWFMLIVSVIVIFWLQPALPIRGADFFTPLATLTLVVLTWFITADDETRKQRKNYITLAIVAGVVLLLNLTRFLPANFQLLTASRPPQLETTLVIFLITGLTLLALSRLTRFSASFLTVGLVLTIGLFLALKVPTLTYWTVYFLRSLSGQNVDASRITDFAWLGFSYVAFRLIHTIRDKQSGRFPAVDVGEFITYVIFFPAFTAGPIDHIERFIKDLRAPFAGLNLEKFYSASQRLLLGLFKKFVIADALALIALNDTNATQVTSTFWMWIIVYAYAFQIYFDFSGYTDIALGIAQLLGIKLPENFASPYLKPNLTQFWNNWHMTLTQWFRAYFFNPITRWLRSWQKPLSIPMMILLTQIATMLLIGFWHGVTWNFTLWGLWHGLGLFIHNRWNDATKAKAAAWATTPAKQAILNISGILLTFHFVAIGWIFFALSSPITSWQVVLKLFGV
ncbi:MAG: MBOAT family protein [Anaerolineales bacterium]|nr:MBOAT family protein [Anaerolineales bacterium]